MKTTTRKLICALLVVSIITVAFGPAMAAQKANKQKNNEVSDDVVLQWNQIAYNRMPGGSPFPTLRYMATIQLAVFEAVNSITGKYQPYLGTISAPAGASPDAAAIMAAHDTLTDFFGPSARLDAQRTPRSPRYLTDSLKPTVFRSARRPPLRCSQTEPAMALLHHCSILRPVQTHISGR